MSSMRAWLVCGLVLFTTGCPDADSITPPPPAPETPVEHTVAFAGYVYDGATGARIDSYSLDVQVADLLQNGTITDGRYLAPPISAWDDFTILIDSSGYRTFRSHNAHIGLPAELAQSDDIADISTLQTLHFDAYLFPEGLQSPAVTFTIGTDTGATPSGTIRLRPQGKSLLEDSAAETPSGVPGQLWSNDEDLQAKSISRSFADGTLAINAGDLVYGVTYQVSIYDVDGFQPLEATYTAGVETNKSFDLAEEVSEPIEVVSSTANSCTPPSLPSAMSGAIVTVLFNQDIEEADSGYPGGAAEALDEGLSMTSPNFDMDADINTLQTNVSNSVQEKGVTLTFSGATMTIAWNSFVGLAILDDGDPILSVTYSGLGNVLIQRTGSPSSATSLSALLGSSITCTP
jgi:hypothetical protein